MGRRKKSSLSSWKWVAPILLIIFTGFAYVRFLNPGDKETTPKAAIIDGLLDFPNPEFIQEVTEILSENGFLVDQYRYENVTIKLYRKLPSLGYSLIILRVHAGPLLYTLSNGSKIMSRDVILFTTEKYDQKRYVELQAGGLLAKATIMNREEFYFAIPPIFVERAMQGSFDNTTIILDSCYGLFGKSMPEAFLGRGASEFIGWDGEVTAYHADKATLKILKSHFDEGLSLQKSIENIEPDPSYGGEIHCFP